MALNTGKRIVWRSWGVIPMKDKVNNQVSTLGSNQPDQFIFTNRHGHPIVNVKIPGVDQSNVNHIEIPGVDSLYVDNIEIPGVDVDIQEPQVIEIVDLDNPPTDPASIELAPMYQVAATVYPVPAVKKVEPELCRSSRGSTQTEKYTPSMSGPEYFYAVTELESQGVLNLDTHIFL